VIYKVVFKKENMDSSNQIKNKIYTSGISVKEVTNLKKNELKYFPKNLIVNCKNIEKAIIYLNEDILLKIKNEFDINSKVVFKKSTNSLYEIPFYFSENEECVFNKGKYSNVDLKNNVMSAVKNYLKLNGRQ
jgi:site-specific recombinase XerD